MSQCITSEQLAYLERLEKACPHLECDGMTHAISQWLWMNGVDHVRAGGTLTAIGDASIPHYWIILPDGSYLDFRARMWFGPEAPHGLFKLPVKGFRYNKTIETGPVQSHNRSQIFFGINYEQHA